MRTMGITGTDTMRFSFRNGFRRPAFRKDIYREIKNTFGRFIAIFAIVLLGVSFFTGIGSTGLDMKLTGDAYFTEMNLMDIRVVSTYGINDNDVRAIKNVPGVKAVYPSYSTDALVNNGDSQIIVKIHGLGADTDIVNVPNLISGRMPTAANEAVAERGFVNLLGLQPGDSFILESGKKTDLRDSLKNVRFKLVGIINSVYYVSNAERGSSSIGSGSAQYFMYVPESNFRQNVYSEAFVTVSGADVLQCFSGEYEDMIDSVTDRLEDLGDTRVVERYIEATENAFGSLDSAEEKLTASKAAASEEFENLYASVGEARQSLASALSLLAVKKGGLDEATRELDSAKRLIRGGLSALNQAAEAARAKEKELAGICVTLTEAITSLDRETSGLAEKEALLRSVYLDDPQTLLGYINDINAARAAISAARVSLQNDLESAFAGENAAREARSGIAAQKETLEAQLAALLTQPAAITDGEIEIASGYAGVINGINNLDRQLEILAEQESESDRTIRESFAQIRAARKTLNDMDKPKWYVMDRDSNPGYSGYLNDADKIVAIGKVFPAIFFIVAALVSLTTMTRLVEERRIEIGTLKSLGYGDYKIISKYIIYASIPTVSGGIIGGIFGMRFFPYVIISTYQMLYTIPRMVIVLNGAYWALGILIGTVSTLGATIAACNNELRSMPAILMRPKPPKSGARIFLERLPLIWNSLTFIWKVTVRNIIRYKKRFYMTVAGIAGCTALLITGFGLRDSIASMISLQYGDVNLYDITVSFTDTAKKSDMDAAETLLRDSDIVRGVMRFRQKAYDSGSANNDKGIKSVNLITPSDAESFREYVDLHDRLTREKYEITENGALISEKLASQLGISAGDMFYIVDEGEHLDITVAGIVENYYMHYIFIHESLYAKIFGSQPVYNAMYALLGDHTDEQKRLLANSLLEKKGVGAIFLTSTIFGTFNRMIDSLNFVVFVLIVSAAALAVVVLLNLTSINISERKRELATIEVLGFFDKEVSAYVYRENFVLTLIGAAVGLVFGMALHAFVIQTAETDFMMFGRSIKPESFLYSTALTLLFASLVNILTSKRLKKINMVEALKSVE